jgi:hypothetical protein
VAVAATVVQPPALQAVAEVVAGCQIAALIHNHSGNFT